MKSKHRYQNVQPSSIQKPSVQVKLVYSICDDQLLVSLFDITNIYINVLYKDIKIGSALVTLFDITNLYKQDAVSVTRLQCICGIGFGFASKFQKSMPLMQYA